MRKSKFSESQIVGISREAESDVSVEDLLRKDGVSKATFFKWRSKYGGASEIERGRKPGCSRSVTHCRGPWDDD